LDGKVDVEFMANKDVLDLRIFDDWIIYSTCRSSFHSADKFSSSYDFGAILLHYGLLDEDRK
jgi:hypothetical protein